MKLISTGLLVAALTTANPMTVFADDNESACGAVLCLAGVMATGGSGGSQCADYIKDYFSIVKFHNRHFDLTGTLNARTSFTNQCQSASPDSKNSVNGHFGSKESF
jgi:hypothetical protein